MGLAQAGGPRMRVELSLNNEMLTKNQRGGEGFARCPPVRDSWVRTWRRFGSGRCL